MTALSLLRKSLKDDEVIDVLEKYDVDVIYSFDRNHENMPDIYWATIAEAGMQLRFDEHQILNTVFCYVEPREAFDAVALDDIGVPLYESHDIAEQACQKAGYRYKTSGDAKAWLKILGSTHDTHYEFKDDHLSMVTLMIPWNEDR